MHVLLCMLLHDLLDILSSSTSSEEVSIRTTTVTLLDERQKFHMHVGYRTKLICMHVNKIINNDNVFYFFCATSKSYYV